MRPKRRAPSAPVDPLLSRRALLRGGLVGGGLVLAQAFPLPVARAAADASDRPEVLTPARWQLLEAITARLIPTDHEPGAREAGCVNFIDKALAHEDAAARPLYEAGLDAVEGEARAHHARPFAELSPDEQDALLVAIEAGRTRAWPEGQVASPLFFETVRIHTVLGFLSDPSYGGNREFAGWKVTGYPGPRHRRGGYTPEQVRGEEAVRPIWEGAGSPKGTGKP